MKTWWSVNSLAEVLRPVRLALIKENCRQSKILTFSARKVFSSLALHWGYRDKVSAAPLALP